MCFLKRLYSEEENGNGKSKWIFLWKFRIDYYVALGYGFPWSLKGYFPVLRTWRYNFMEIFK